MNIFEKETGFIGDAPLEHLKQNWEKFWQHTATIRQSLMTKTYLLDNYLELLFASVNNTLAQDAAEEGLGKLHEQRRLISDILEGKGEHQTHSLYEKVKAYIEKHPTEYQERTTTHSFYLLGLADEFLEPITQEFSRTETDGFCGDIDFVRLKELYKKICVLLGSVEPVERLNFLFKQCFLLVPTMIMFLQGFINDLIYTLTYRDDETHRLVFQLYLDGMEE